MPIKTCTNPNCHQEHDRNTRYCPACHRRAKLYGDPNAPDRRRPSVAAQPPTTLRICSPGVCNAPATQRRAIFIGGANANDLRSIWLHLCPSCAALFDAEEKRTITYTIPARTAISGHIYR